MVRPSFRSAPPPPGDGPPTLCWWPDGCRGPPWGLIQKKPARGLFLSSEDRDKKLGTPPGANAYNGKVCPSPTSPQITQSRNRTHAKMFHPFQSYGYLWCLTCATNIVHYTIVFVYGSAQVWRLVWRWPFSPLNFKCGIRPCVLF